ncbi:hypothetical protein ACMD2_21691 [Ananas comosus]|uniref:Endonuclease/exonuclease/phosphatase domain-containing protein n=1 Tax=Ananas comosus TaxID=4615 RepID=A0A199VIS1_ANACO|nr:hypothetical protein ACMD2_21691 [Ananas comosus]
MALFADLISNLEAIDLPLSNQNFTWSNMQHTPTLAKLDRFLVSTEWDQSFLLCKVKALPRITSDHTPIVLSTRLPPASRRFWFERVWLSNEDFRSKVPLWWSEVASKNSDILTITAKLRHCREGDGNTKFFYVMANDRKRNNYIEVIKDDAGRQITDDKLKRSYFFQSYKRVFGRAEDCPTSIGD